MIVSHRHRFIFLKTRKTAGSSLEVLLARYCGPEDIVTPLGPADEALRPDDGPRNHGLPFWHWPANAYLKLLRGQKLGPRWTGLYPHMEAKAARRAVGEPVWSSYFKFSSERNPWDREVSLYYWRNRADPDAQTFEQFLKSDDHRARHLRNFEIYTIKNRVATDDIVLFHDMTNGLGRIFDKLGLEMPNEIPCAKTGFRPDRDYRRYYTDETRDLVARRYVREIETFGFTF